MNTQIEHWTEIGHLVYACPFCDSSDQMLLVHDDMDGDAPITHQVYCQTCAASGPVGDTLGRALLYWNDSVSPRLCALN